MTDIFELYNLRNRLRNGEFDDDVFKKQDIKNYLVNMGVEP